MHKLSQKWKKNNNIFTKDLIFTDTDTQYEKLEKNFRKLNIKLLT